MASQQKKDKIFNLTPQKSPLSNSFFQKGSVNHQQLPQRINQNYHFTYENMPKVNCHYHVDQYITMFCRSQSCQMPLCPQCVKIHSQEHQAYNTYGDFDTLESCLSEAYQVVANHCNKFVEEMGSVQKMSGTNEGVQFYMDKVKQARQQCYQIIDNFFNTLEAELAGEIEQNRSFTSTQSTNFSKYLVSRWKTLMGFLEKLNTEKCVKGLVKFYCSDFERENEEYFHESNQFVKQLNRCTPEVLIDQSALYELNIDLAKFISLKKVATYKNMPPTKEINPYSQAPPPPQPNNSNYLLPVTSNLEGTKQLPIVRQESRHESRPDTRQSGVHPYLLTPPKTTNFY